MGEPKLTDSSILRMLPWGLVNGLFAGLIYASGVRGVFVGYLVFSAWWIGGNVAEEIRRG